MISVLNPLRRGGGWSATSNLVPSTLQPAPDGACASTRQRPPTILHILRPETHGKHPPHRPGGPKIQNSSLRVPSENSTIGKSVRAPARMRSPGGPHHV